jgi:hypothetical protein
LSILAIILIRLKPTVPYCQFIHQIGLAIRMKLMEELPNDWIEKMKIVIKCVEGSHNNAIEI